MISYLIFCHENGESSEGHSLVGKTDGFARIPAFLKEIFLDEAQINGSAIINGQEIIGNGKKGSVLLIKGAEIEYISKYAGPSPANAVEIAQKISAYKEPRSIRLDQELLLQKVLLAVFQELQAGAPFLYINLESCPEATILLDALEFAFPFRPILFSLPPYLDFSLPELGETYETGPEELSRETPSLNDATRSFFEEIIGIQKANPANIPITKTRKDTASPKQQPSVSSDSLKSIEKNTPKKAEKKSAISAQPKARKAITPEKKKDNLWNGAFSFLFFALSTICPYLFFWFSESRNPLYFALYLILQIFFLAMAALPISYILSDGDYFSKRALAIICSIAPILAVVQCVSLYFIAQSCGWSGYPVYVFCGASLGYLLLYPALLFLYKKLDERSKRKGKKKTE